MKILIFLVTLCILKIECHSESDEKSKNDGFQEQFHWGLLNFKFPNATIRDQAIASKSYIPDKNTVLSIDVWQHKLFISVFRFYSGVASSLNYFDINSTTKSPLLIPYPSFDDNYVNEDSLERTLSLTSNSSVICATYIHVDQCDRLWVVDSGYTAYFGHNRIIASPAILIFNLQTDQLIRRFIIPDQFLNSNSFFVNLVVDFDGRSCEDSYAYVADTFRSVLIYSFKKDRAWRMTHNYFGSDPESGNFFFGNLNYQWNYGVYGLALGDSNEDGSRRVYISHFSATRTYYISNCVLQNEAYLASNHYFYDVHELGDRGKDGQIFSMSYDGKRCILFDTQFARQQIGCWNTATRFGNTSFGVVYKGDPSFFPLDTVIDRKRNLWVLSSRMPTFIAGTWSKKTKNVQIFKQNVDDAVAGTVCSLSRLP